MITSPNVTVTPLHARVIEPGNFMFIVRAYEVDDRSCVVACVPNSAFRMNLKSRFKGDVGFFDSGTPYWFGPAGVVKGAIRDALTRAGYATITFQGAAAPVEASPSTDRTLEFMGGR